MIVDSTDIKVIFSMDAKNLSPIEHLDFGDGYALNEQPVSVSYDGIAVFVNKSRYKNPMPNTAVEQHLQDLRYLHGNIDGGVDAIYVYKHSMDKQSVVGPLINEARELGIKVIMEEGDETDDCDFSMPFSSGADDRKKLRDF